jgi:predicted methyltransferase MtxX (methanogen marker protein 4)
MSTSLQASKLDLADCLKRGEAIMREAGLTANLQVQQLSVSGEQGEYTASVRCLPGKDVVLFVVAGPRPDRASKYMAALKDKF